MHLYYRFGYICNMRSGLLILLRNPAKQNCHVLSVLSTFITKEFEY